MILLAQANREGWKRARANNGAYEMTAIAEANEMERSSSFVVSVYSDEDMRVSKEIGVQLLKNRYGETIETPYVAFVDPRYYVIGTTPNDDFTKPFDIGANEDSLDCFFTETEIDLYKMLDEEV